MIEIEIFIAKSIFLQNINIKLVIDIYLFIEFIINFKILKLS